jgi:hypothetical protein
MRTQPTHIQSAISTTATICPVASSKFLALAAAQQLSFSHNSTCAYIWESIQRQNRAAYTYNSTTTTTLLVRIEFRFIVGLSADQNVMQSFTSHTSLSQVPCCLFASPCACAVLQCSSSNESTAALHCCNRCSSGAGTMRHLRFRRSISTTTALLLCASVGATGSSSAQYNKCVS